MGKILDSREVEYAYVDRFVLFHSPNRVPGQTTLQRQQKTAIETYVEDVIDEKGNAIPTEKTREFIIFEDIEVPAGNCNITLQIRYELQDINRNIISYSEKDYELYSGEANKSVPEILDLISLNLLGVISSNKVELSGFVESPKPEEIIAKPVEEIIQPIEEIKVP